MRIHIRGDKERTWMRNWIRACFILHNLVIDIEGDEADEEGRHAMMRDGAEEELRYEGQGGLAEESIGAEDPRLALMRAIGLV